MVEGVEGLEPQFKSGSSFTEYKGLEQGHIEVEQPRPDNRVPAGIAEAFVRPAVPRSDWACKRAGAKPSGPRLGVGNRRHLVRAVGSSAAQPQGIGAVIDQRLRRSRFRDRYPGELPASKDGAQRRAGTCLLYTSRCV